MERPFGYAALVSIAPSISLRTLRFGSAGLYPVASLAAAAIAYGLADVTHGSGFLAVYLCGLALGSVVLALDSFVHEPGCFERDCLAKSGVSHPF